jgi:DNA-binding phage protein
MASGARKVVSLLACIQDEAMRRRTTPYQIAKATGLPLRSVQKLLAQTTNPTLKNIEMILDGFGLSILVIEVAKPRIKPGRSRLTVPRVIAS